MEIVVTPSKEVVARALRLGFEDAEKCYYNQSKTTALFKSKMFDPIYYLGTTTILKHKLRKNIAYALTRSGPVYSGDLLKEAFKVLKKKRVRLFLHYSGEEKDFGVLMIGTKEGTVAIAPRIIDDGKDVHLIEDETELLSDYWRGATGKLIRGVLFGTL